MSKKLEAALKRGAKRGDGAGVVAALGGASPEAAGEALILAARKGHVDCAKMLMQDVDPRFKGEALQAAADGGHARCVELLIQEEGKDRALALAWAARGGHARCVAALLPESDPAAKSVGGYDAAGIARVKGFEDVASMIEEFAQARELSKELSSSIRRAGRRGAPSL